MAIDGRCLAAARARKEQQLTAAVAEDRRRHGIAYERVPELRSLDLQIAALMEEAVAGITGGAARSMEELSAESLRMQARRAEALTAAGFPADWLDGAWSCPLCRDKGYVEDRMCSCLRALYEEEQSKELSTLFKLGDETFASFRLDYYDDRPYEDTGLSPRENMDIILRICQNYAARFGPESPNLMFRGPTGLGKTFLSSCIAHEVAGRGHSVVYETVISCLEIFENRKFGRGDTPPEELSDRVRRILGCDLLILDDLGTELSTEYTQSALYEIINTRLVNNKKTILSTNLTPADITRRYSAPLVSRWEGEYQILHFIGRDIRKIKKERSFS